MSTDSDRSGSVPYTHVPRPQWGAFFDDFSRDKLNQPVTVEVETPQEGRHELAHDSPLLGITASSEHSSHCTIELVMGPGASGHQSHTIDQPERVTVIPAADGQNYSIEIEAPSEVVAIHWREPAAHPE
jgi:hypothetical protein